MSFKTRLKPATPAISYSSLPSGGSTHHQQQQQQSPPLLTPDNYVAYIPQPTPPVPLVQKRRVESRGLAGNTFLFLLLILGILFLLLSRVLDADEIPMFIRFGSGRIRRGAGGNNDLMIQLDAERTLRAAAEEKADRLSTELLELNRKHRDLEAEFHDMALTARAQQAAAQQQAAAVVVKPSNDVDDVSTLQRLAKCRTAVDASTETIKELRRHNEDVANQVQRLQRELKEAVADVDEAERLLNDCRLASTVTAPDEEPPPPPS